MRSRWSGSGSRRAAPRGTLSQLSGRRSMSPPQFGGAVYVVDFQIFARNVGYFSALVETTNQPLELAAHLVFGAVLAALLLLAKPRAAARTKP
jgi:hypothetical protein